MYLFENLNIFDADRRYHIFTLECSFLFSDVFAIVLAFLGSYGEEFICAQRSSNESDITASCS